MFTKYLVGWSALQRYSYLIPHNVSQHNRTISVSSIDRIKEIVVTKEGKTTVIEGAILPSPRMDYLFKVQPTVNAETHKDVLSGKDFKTTCFDDACPVCRLNLDIKHTDVLILSQFVRSDGGMLPRRTTGLCRIQQKRMSKMVTMALKAGLMPNLAPPNSKRDPARRDKFKKNHRYYDETTIRPPVRLHWPNEKS